MSTPVTRPVLKPRADAVSTAPRPHPMSSTASSPRRSSRPECAPTPETCRVVWCKETTGVRQKKYGVERQRPRRMHIPIPPGDARNRFHRPMANNKKSPAHKERRSRSLRVPSRTICKLWWIAGGCLHLKGGVHLKREKWGTRTQRKLSSSATYDPYNICTLIRLHQ